MADPGRQVSGEPAAGAEGVRGSGHGGAGRRGAGSRPEGSPGNGRREESRLRRVLRRALQLGLTVVVTWFLFAQVDLSLARLSELRAERWTPDAGLLAGSVAVLLAGYLLSVHYWTRLVRALGGKRLRFLESNQIFFTANLARYVPGKVWQIAGLAYLSRRRGVEPVAATTAAVLGQGFTVAGALLVGALPLAGGAVDRLRLGPWAGVAVAAGLAALCVPPVFRRLLRLVFRLTDRPPPAEGRLDAWFGIRWTLLYALMWVLYGAAFWALARSFGIGAPAPALTSVFAAAYAAGYLALFAPVGLGVREGVLTALLSPHMAPAAALGLAVVSRVWMTAVELLPALPLAARYLQREWRSPPSADRPPPSSRSDASEHRSPP